MIEAKMKHTLKYIVNCYMHSLTEPTMELSKIHLDYLEKYLSQVDKELRQDLCLKALVVITEGGYGIECQKNKLEKMYKEKLSMYLHGQRRFVPIEDIQEYELMY